MGEIRYGVREGSPHGKEIPAAADQYFHNRGGHFCYLVAGNVTLCATGATVIGGWVNAPKQADGYSAWKSSSTAEKDKVFVMTGVDTVFEMPYDGGNASIAASLVGHGVGIVNAGSTYTTIQKAKYGSTASPLTIVDCDTINKTVFVKINPNNKQAI